MYEDIQQIDTDLTLAEDTSEISSWIVYLDKRITAILEQLNSANKKIAKLEEKLSQYEGDL